MFYVGWSRSNRCWCITRQKAQRFKYQTVRFWLNIKNNSNNGAVPEEMSVVSFLNLTYLNEKESRKQFIHFSHSPLFTVAATNLPVLSVYELVFCCLFVFLDFRYKRDRSPGLDSAVRACIPDMVVFGKFEVCLNHPAGQCDCGPPPGHLVGGSPLMGCAPSCPTTFILCHPLEPTLSQSHYVKQLRKVPSEIIFR